MSATKHLTVKELLYFHSGILDGNGRPRHQRQTLLSATVERRILQHLATCAGCAEKVRAYTHTTEVAQSPQPSRRLLWLRRVTLPAVAAVAALALVAVLIYPRPAKNVLSTSHTSDYRESLVTLHKNGQQIGSAKMAPYTVMNIVEKDMTQQRVQIAEGAAEITLDQKNGGRIELQGDHGKIQIAWTAREAALPVRFWVFDRDERIGAGAPDFYVKVTSGTLEIPANAIQGKNEFSAGDMFMVYKNNLVAIAR
ncbi:MAG: hypothetical protein JSR44_08935 [Spirochaetes bacterium]|nr:hypothetical protein [Spirochaetota bacterium]